MQEASQIFVKAAHPRFSVLAPRRICPLRIQPPHPTTMNVSARVRQDLEGGIWLRQAIVPRTKGIARSSVTMRYVLIYQKHVFRDDLSHSNTYIKDDFPPNQATYLHMERHLLHTVYIHDVGIINRQINSTPYPHTLTPHTLCGPFTY